jgi:two-component system sensor kinase FixL
MASRLDGVRCLALRSGGARSTLCGMLFHIGGPHRQWHRLWPALNNRVGALRLELTKAGAMVRRQDEELQRLRAEIRKLQAELARATRVGTLETLTGPLAHELNQPLTAIRANAQAALRLLAAPQPDLAEVRAALNDIVSDESLAFDLIQRLRGLIRKDQPQQILVDLNGVVRDVVRILRYHAMDHEVALTASLQPDAISIAGDRIQLQQIVLNLTLNAIDAVKDMDVARRAVSVATRYHDGFAEVAVRDRGRGVPEHELHRIFEPFWTTKPAGMGLGLTICRSLADAHGGSVVAARNGRGGGMTFTARFALKRPSGATGSEG